MLPVLELFICQASVYGLLLPSLSCRRATHAAVYSMLHLLPDLVS